MERTAPPSSRLTGGCQCGAVRFACDAPPENVHVCHCRMCQKAVGGPFAVICPVSKASFRLTRGEMAWFQSSEVARRGFCRTCGTPMAFDYPEDEGIGLLVGTFDQPDRGPSGRAVRQREPAALVRPPAPAAGKPGHLRRGGPPGLPASDPGLQPAAPRPRHGRMAAKGGALGRDPVDSLGPWPPAAVSGTQSSRPSLPCPASVRVRQQRLGIEAAIDNSWRADRAPGDHTAAV